MTDSTGLLERLKSADINFTLVEHKAVPTADAQVEELAGKLDGAVVKSLFLKDKKGRLYLVCLLSSTKLQLKVIAARLGVGKTGMSMAPEELIGEVLKVPLGSVTPLALAHSSADKVHLLVDHHIRDQALVIVHPLVNTASIALTPAALEAALGLFGRKVSYVDLEIEPVIDKDSPPDLVAVRDSGATTGPTAVNETSATAADGAGGPPPPAPAAASSSGQAGAASTSSSTSKAPPPNPNQLKQKPAASKGGAKAPARPQQSSVLDVAARTEDIIALVASAFGSGEAMAGLDTFVQQRLRADIEVQLNALRNASFASGYVAGKGELVAAAQRSFA